MYIGKPKILIVDDNEVNLLLLKDGLADTDAEIIASDNGNDALALMIEHEFALVLLDVRMPEMDGYEVVKLMRKNPKTENVPVIMATAYNKNEQDMIKGFEAGAVDFIFKPLNLNLLRSKVNVFLDLYDSTRRIYEKIYKRLSYAKKDIVDKKHKIQFAATHDSVTGANNRFAFELEFKKLISNSIRNNRMFGLLVIDLDDFKTLNDTHDHVFGDKVLKHIRTVIDKNLRQEDFLARIGGDEFAVLISDIKEFDDLGSVAIKIIESFKKINSISGKKVKLTACIGMSNFPLTGKSYEELIKQADIAMIDAKKAGKGCYRFFSEELNSKFKRRIEIETNFENAIKNKELQLYYQPIVKAIDGNIVGAESLIRWKSKELGNVSPGEFIPVIEHTGAIKVVGHWILKESFSNIFKWDKKFNLDDLHFTVNVSPRQLIDKNVFTASLEKLYNKYPLAQGIIEFEITETALIEFDLGKLFEDSNKNTLFSSFPLLIDDFGTGYSSMSRLIQLPVKTLKIDKVFIDGIDLKEKKTKSNALVLSMINLAHNLSLKTVAEGVETEQQLEFLKHCGCDFIQGYYFYKPMPKEEFEKLLTKR